MAVISSPATLLTTSVTRTMRPSHMTSTSVPIIREGLGLRTFSISPAIGASSRPTQGQLWPR